MFARVSSDQVSLRCSQIEELLANEERKREAESSEVHDSDVVPPTDDEASLRRSGARELLRRGEGFKKKLFRLLDYQ